MIDLAMEDSCVLYLKDQKFEDLFLCFCGYAKCEAGHSFGPAVRPNYIIHYILEGKGYYQVGEQKYHLSKGQGFLIEPETLTFYQADKQEPWSYLWIGFAGNNAENYLRDIGLNHEQLTFQSQQAEELKATIRTMLKYTIPTTSDLYEIQSLLYRFFSILTKDALIDSSQAPSQSNIYIERAIDYIRNNYFRGIKVQDIADYLCVNRSYLYTLFEKNLNISPKDFLTKFRITRAQELLSYSEIPIESVALSCGYQDTLVFSKAFKRSVNVTPSEYRKNVTLQMQAQLHSFHASSDNILTATSSKNI